MVAQIYPIILSGGAGSRLWPTSRSKRPKQFLALHSDNPMIVDTAQRVIGHGFKQPTFICSNEHRFLVAQCLKEANLEHRAIILEPMGRDTAAAVAIAALHVAQEDPDGILLILPSDHIIENQNAFSRALDHSIKLAQHDAIVTFGVTPTHPETAYGYIKATKAFVSAPKSGFHIDHFVEKPDEETARQYLEQGGYYWNSGMFVARAKTLIQEFKIYAPDILTTVEETLKHIQHDLDFQRLPEALFSDIPALPVDKAIMEKTSIATVTPLDAGWSDVGSWTGLWDASAKDKSGNVIKGKPIIEDVKNSLIYTNNESITAVMGLEDIIVVNDTDALLVASKDYAQNVKDIVSTLKRRGHNAADLHATVYRPWGNYRDIATGSNFRSKIITVYPGCALSLQYHNRRAEHWVIVDGCATVTRGDDCFILEKNQSTFIAQGQTHRLENKTDYNLSLIEIQTGDYLEEDDIIRLEDIYGRLED